LPWLNQRFLKTLEQAQEQSRQVVSIVFGREESGLTNEEMQLCDITSTISMKSHYPSLNLSHAVMLFAYELSDVTQALPDKPEINRENSYQTMKIKVKELLGKIGIKENDNRYGRILERISFLGDDDIHLVNSLCPLVSEKLEEGQS
jgi:tRNA/rRNA methyltransferase